jgi:polyribonucleotide 5'-hydroxyl-kinase
VVSYINTHQVLHNLRTAAAAAGGQGPRVLVAGPTDSGKSTLCRCLLNWAVRSSHQPTFIDLDIGEEEMQRRLQQGGHSGCLQQQRQ